MLNLMGSILTIVIYDIVVEILKLKFIDLKLIYFKTKTILITCSL